MKIKIFNQEGEVEFIGENENSVFYSGGYGGHRGLNKSDRGVIWDFVESQEPIAPDNAPELEDESPDESKMEDESEPEDKSELGDGS